jgi:hypothetical protein
MATVSQECSDYPHTASSYQRDGVFVEILVWKKPYKSQATHTFKAHSWLKPKIFYDSFDKRVLKDAVSRRICFIQSIMCFSSVS